MKPEDIRVGEIYTMRDGKRREVVSITESSRSRAYNRVKWKRPDGDPHPPYFGSQFLEIFAENVPRITRDAIARREKEKASEDLYTACEDALAVLKKIQPKVNCDDAWNAAQQAITTCELALRKANGEQARA